MSTLGQTSSASSLSSSTPNPTSASSCSSSTLFSSYSAWRSSSSSCVVLLIVTVQMRMGGMPTLSHGNVLSYATSSNNKLIKHVPEAHIIWSRELSQLWKYLRIPLLSSVAQETGHPSGHRRSTTSPAYGMVSKDCVFDITVDSDY